MHHFHIHISQMLGAGSSISIDLPLQYWLFDPEFSLLYSLNIVNIATKNPENALYSSAHHHEWLSIIFG